MDPVLKKAGKISRRDPNFLVYYFLFSAIDKAVKTHARGRVLDIGCGNKPYKNIFDSTNAVTSYTGCDISQNEFGTVDIISEAGNIPLQDGSCDTIFSTQVIEHLPENAPMLAETKRLLTPGGKLILSGPLYWPVHGEPDDYFRFTRYGFKTIIEKAGLKLIEISENGGAWATAGQALVHSFSLSTRKTLFFRSLRFIFFKLRFIYLVNSFYKWLDKKDYNPANTINYVIVAEK